VSGRPSLARMRTLPRVAVFAYSLSKQTVAQKPDATKRPERGFSDGPFAFGGPLFGSFFCARCSENAHAT